MHGATGDSLMAGALSVNVRTCPERQIAAAGKGGEATALSVSASLCRPKEEASNHVGSVLFTGGVWSTNAEVKPGVRGGQRAANAK